MTSPRLFKRRSVNERLPILHWPWSFIMWAPLAIHRSWQGNWAAIRTFGKTIIRWMCSRWWHSIRPFLTYSTRSNNRIRPINCWSSTWRPNAALSHSRASPCTGNYHCHSIWSLLPTVQHNALEIDMGESEQGWSVSHCIWNFINPGFRYSKIV